MVKEADLSNDGKIKKKMEASQDAWDEKRRNEFDTSFPHTPFPPPWVSMGKINHAFQSQATALPQSSQHPLRWAV